MKKKPQEEKDPALKEVILTNKGQFNVYDLNVLRSELEKKPKIPLTNKEETI
jgi:hypothetical protein